MVKPTEEIGVIEKSKYRMVVDLATILLQDENFIGWLTMEEIVEVLEEEIAFRVDEVYLFRSLRSRSLTFKTSEIGGIYRAKYAPRKRKPKARRSK